MHTQPSSTVHIVGGERFVHALNKTERLKRKASSLLLAVDPHYCLTIPITPRGDTVKDRVKSTLLELIGRFQFSMNLKLYKDLKWFCSQEIFAMNHQNNVCDLVFS